MPAPARAGAALDWALSHGGQSGPQLAAALGSFWLASGRFQEARTWLDRALAIAQDAPQAW